VDWDELPRWTLINKALGLGSPDPAETYSNSPHLYAELSIPEEAGSTVGKARKSPVKRRETQSEAKSETPARAAPARPRAQREGAPAAANPPPDTPPATRPQPALTVTPPRRRHPAVPEPPVAVVAGASPQTPPHPSAELALTHGQT